MPTGPVLPAPLDVTASARPGTGAGLIPLVLCSELSPCHRGSFLASTVVWSIRQPPTPCAVHSFQIGGGGG